MATPETWTTIALPLLEEVAAGETTDPQGASAAVLSKAGHDPATQQQLAALIEDGYLTGATPHWGLGSSRPVIVADILRLTPKGRRALGQWPGEISGETLIRILQTAMQELPEGEEKGRLRRFLEAAEGVGVDLLSSIVAKLAKTATGLP
jgi:hypothetical protein